MKKIVKYTILIIATVVVGILPAEAKSKLTKATSDSIAAALQNITLQEVAGSYVKVKNSIVKGQGKRGSVEIYASVELAYYPMRPESVEAIYQSVRELLPEKNRESKLKIYADGRLIEELIPLYHSSSPATHRYTNPSQRPLITRSSAISQPTKGLADRHIALWQSHGYYFKQETDEWKWQRPRLWETVEDLFTQSYVIPYILPMLERAGATVLLPRERSTQTEELIIDNNEGIEGIDNTIYTEHNGSKKWEDGGIGFAHLYECYPSGHNPFMDGTTRKVATTTTPNNLTTASWGGEIPRSGIYSLYVSYTTLPESVSDACYIVHATGGDREFRVNQQMGGGMWVCLGDFYFEEGYHDRY